MIPRESRFAIMFREDSQIDFVKENVILNISLRPSLPSACTFYFKADSQFMCQLPVKDDKQNQA